MVEKRPYVLGKKGEDVLKAVHFYRYMTVLDVAYLLFAPKALVRVRQLLHSLCGGWDFVKNQFLYRFRLPDVTAGNPERVYVLGAKGREFVSGELGLQVDRGFRHDEGKHLSFSQVRHNLSLTRLLVASQRWVAGVESLKISEIRICYDLSGVVEKVEVEERGRRESVPGVPDAWLHFERDKAGASGGRFPLLLEVDRGTMYRQRFKRHVASRIEFVRSGGYKRLFGTEAVLIAYVATGGTEESEEGRRRALSGWTMEVLKEQRRERWARTFLFGSVPFGQIYARALFEERLWYRPGREEPVGLFEG